MLRIFVVFNLLAWKVPPPLVCPWCCIIKLFRLPFGVVVYARVFDIAALSNVAVLQRLHDAIRLLLERFPPPQLSCHLLHQSTGQCTQQSTCQCLSIWYSRSITCSCVAEKRLHNDIGLLLEMSPPPFIVNHHKALPTRIWGHCLCPSIWYSRSIKCSCVAKTARRYTFCSLKGSPPPLHRLGSLLMQNTNCCKADLLCLWTFLLWQECDQPPHIVMPSECCHMHTQ